MFDEAAATRAVAFMESLTLVEGAWAGKRVKLMPWQRELFRKVFGTLRPDGTRQYRTVYVEIPKKNAKTPTGAMFADYLAFADGEQGGQVYFAASEREQAGLCYRHASGMVRGCPALERRSRILDGRKRLEIPSTNSYLQVLSAEAYSKHGYNISGLIFDELHSLPNRELYDTLTFGTGLSRQQPLHVILTTAGYDRNSIAWEVHEHARQVAEGIIEDPAFLPIIYGAGEEEDWEDEAVWRRVNPSLGITITIEGLRGEFAKAKASPANENNFRRFCLNQWVRQETRWLRMADWDACNGPVDEKALEGWGCYAGLDLASTTDLTAFVMVFFPKDGEPIRVIPRFWVPGDSLHERVQRDRVPYDAWARAGLITVTDGNVADYSRIQADIEADCERFGVKELAYDRWGAVQLVQNLQNEGLTVIPFGQGFASMSAPAKELEKLVLGRQIAHGGHPILRWMADNVVIRQDPAGNIKPDKSKSTERIDGVVALIEGLDRGIRHEKDASVYEERGLVIL